MVVPAGNPPWSAVRRISSGGMLPRYPVEADPLPPPATAVSDPQSPSATVPPDTDCPSATRPVTAEPELSPLAAPARAVACARATMLLATISPLKTLRLFTSADADAAASLSVAADALAFAEPLGPFAAGDVVSLPE